MGLQHRTLRAYRLALDSFLKFIKKRDISQFRFSRLDGLLAEFINHSFQEGEPMAYSGHLLSAIKRFHPEFRLHLPVSSQYYKNWARSYTPARATPASWELVEAMISVALDSRQLAMGLMLGLGFHCLLRTSEMLELTPQHLMVHRGSRAMSVILPRAKTSQGNPQVLQVDDPQLIALVLQLKSIVSASRGLFPMWGFGAHAFRSSFQRILATLGFPAAPYQPYSLRRGGATWYYQATLSLDRTVQRGRWACARTAKLYIDEGTMQLAHLNWTKKQSRLVQHWRLKGVRLRQSGKKWSWLRGFFRVSWNLYPKNFSFLLSPVIGKTEAFLGA